MNKLLNNPHFIRWTSFNLIELENKHNGFLGQINGIDVYEVKE